MGVARAAPVPFLRDALMKTAGRTDRLARVAHKLPRCDAARQTVRAVAATESGTHLLRRTAIHEPTGVVLPPAPGPASCPRFVRRRIAARLPEICEALIDLAVAGDLHAAKLLWQMAELDKPAKTAPGSGRTKTSVGFARKALAEFQAR